MNFRNFATLIILSTTFHFTFADERLFPEKDCIPLLNGSANNGYRQLTNDEMKKAFLALEAAGYKINLALFRKKSPSLNAIVNGAVGGGADLDTLYFSIPKKTSPLELRRQLITDTPPVPRAVAEAHTLKAFKNPSRRKLLLGHDLTISPEQLAEEKDWLKRTFAIISQERRQNPNFATIAGEEDNEAILTAVKMAYGGSLYDAVVDTGFDPAATFQVQNSAKALTVPNMREAILNARKRLTQVSKLPDELAKAVAMEFTLEDLPIAHAVILTLFESHPVNTVADIAEYASDITKSPLEAETVQRILETLAANKTLATFLKIQ